MWIINTGRTSHAYKRYSRDEEKLVSIITEKSWMREAVERTINTILTGNILCWWLHEIKRGWRYNFCSTGQATYIWRSTRCNLSLISTTRCLAGGLFKEYLKNYWLSKNIYCNKWTYANVCIHEISKLRYYTC